MKRILSLGLLCSVVAICIGSGTEQQVVVSTVGDVKESNVLSSLLPDSQSSTYLLAFPVDDVNNGDQFETVQAAGGVSSETVTEKPSSSGEDEKDEVMTVVLSAGDPKDDEKDEVIIPVQDLQPKEEPKKFPPPQLPIIPFRNKPSYQERKFPFPVPFGKIRPTFLPPMRNFLQSLKREQQPINKLSPIDFLSAATLLKRALSNKLRVLNDRYQPPTMEDKFVPFHFPLPSTEPPSPTPPSPLSLFMPLPAQEPMFLPPFSPIHHSMLMLDPPPFLPPPHLPFHPALLLPQFIHPFTIPPTPFIPPLPPFMYNHLPHKPFLHLPPPFPLYNQHPFSFPPPLPPPPPPSFMPHLPPQMHMPEHISSALSEQSFMPQSHHEFVPQTLKGREEEEVMFIPTNEHLSNPEEPTYFVLYPNESEFLQNEMTSKRKSLLDLLRPRPSKVRHVIQQTRIITHYKPRLMGLLNNRLDSPSYHRPIFRIMDS